MPSLQSVVGPGPSTGGSELAGALGLAAGVHGLDTDAVGAADTGAATPIGELSGIGPDTVLVTTTVIVRVAVYRRVTVGVGAGTVTVIRAGPVTVEPLSGWVEAAGSDWLAPPITTPATTPPAPANATGRCHQLLVGSASNMRLWCL